MKIYRANADGTLKKIAKASEQRKVRWEVCYKISEDGTSVDLSIVSHEGEHRGTNEIEALRDLFSLNDPTKNIQQEDQGLENRPGMGSNSIGPDDDDGAGAGVGVLSEPAREEMIREQEPPQTPPQMETA